MESGSRRVFRYSSTHEKEIPDGPIRGRMALQSVPSPCPRKGADGVCSRDWAKEGGRVDRQRPMPPEGSPVLPRRWVVERTLSPTISKGG